MFVKHYEPICRLAPKDKFLGIKEPFNKQGSNTTLINAYILDIIQTSGDVNKTIGKKIYKKYKLLWDMIPQF